MGIMQPRRKDVEHSMGVGAKAEGQADNLLATQERTTEYGVYALWLKQTYCGDITYGRQPCDFTAATLVARPPGRELSLVDGHGEPVSGRLLLFHRDLLSGTALGRRIGQYGVFGYADHEALHLCQAIDSCFSDDKVSLKLGYGRVDNFRQAFLRIVGITTEAYRH